MGPNEQILVELGDSSQAGYSPRGDQLVFVSAKRPGHEHAQAYVRDGAGTERRITFSNGAVQNPRFHPREMLIVYSSSTDELKEQPPRLNPREVASVAKTPPSLSAPTEVYVHGLDSYLRDRLTTRPGFDGEAHFTDDGRAVTFTANVDGRTRVQSLNRATKAVRVLQGLGVNPSDYVVAPDVTASAWLEHDADFTASRLKLRREKQTREVATDRPRAKSDLSFSPDSRWLFWAEFDPRTQAFAPVSLELETGCVRELPFGAAGSRRDPVLSPDGQWLTYTLIGPARSRVARIPFNPRPGPCATQP